MEEGEGSDGIGINRQGRVVPRHQRRTCRQGFPRNVDRRIDCMGANRVDVLDDLWACVLRGGDDARNDAALRPGAVWFLPTRIAPAERFDDRRRHAYQQDGPGTAQGLRPDAGAALRHLDGIMRQWWRILPLLVLGRPRLRPDCACRHLCARMSAECRSAAIWLSVVTEED